MPLGVWVFAGGATALFLAVSARYGFHRDELYFIVAGRRLDWGFVDQPPLVPLVARASETLLGTSPVSLRILPALAVGAVGVLAALMARRLGGGRLAQVFAAFSAGWVGVLLGEGHLLSTAVFDYLLWTLGLWMLVHLLDGADRRLWLGLGLVVGVGLQTKHTIAFFAFAILLALLLTRQRRLLADPLPWVAAVLAGVVAFPNILWQAANGWPQLEMAAALSQRSEGPLAFIYLQPALLSVTLAIPAVAGLWWLARSEEAGQWRPLPVAIGLLFVTFLIAGAKAYYISPMYSVLLAAGSIWFERLAATQRRWVAGISALGVALGLFIALPLLPVETSGTLDLTGELAETVGWPDLIDQVTEVYRSVPGSDRDDVVIFTGSYGEAAAIDVLGPEAGLPAAFSGHNNYWIWGPPQRHGPIIGVGQVSDVLQAACPGVETVGTISNPHGVDNEEAGLPLRLCLQPTRQLAEVWEEVRHYN